MEGYFTVNAGERKKTLVEIANTQASNVKVYLGNEIFLTEKINKILKHRYAVTLNNTRYLLFELPFNVKPINYLDMIFEIQAAGYIPVLAHPERYYYFHKEPELYVDLIKQGVLFQSNFGSFIGQYGRRVKLMAEKLLEANLIQFLATDVHRPNTLYPMIPKILKGLNKKVGEKKIMQLTTVNPSLLLANKPIKVGKISNIKLSLNDKRILNRRHRK